MLKTKEEIADDMIPKLSRHEKHLLKHRPLIDSHSTLGRKIRTDYNLWYDHPLTHPWARDRAEFQTNHIVDGVDCHPNHPDQVSMDIVTLMSKKVREQTLQNNHPVFRYAANTWRNP